MAERLSRKLGEIHHAAQLAGSPAEPTPCLEVDEERGFSAEFQPAPGVAWVLPYQRFSHALWSEEERALLTLVFAAQEVRVEGAHLGPVKAAIARGRNVIVRATAAGSKAGKKGEVFVSRITLIAREGTAPPGEKKNGEAAPQ